MYNNRNLLFMAGFTVILTLLGFLLLVSGIQGDTLRPETTWTRTREPVIVFGSQLPQFTGAALDDLFVYAYAEESWTLVPFQFDEVDASGVYTVENGLLDANDELALMAMDLGDQADLQEWIPDADSQTYPRYQLQVTNPLNPSEQGSIYVYRSATLAPSPPAGYVEWDAGNNQIVAGTYIMGFAPQDHVGVASLDLNGSGVDALDRNKIRLNVTCWVGSFPIEITLTEEDLPQLDPTPDIEGPVRVGGGNTESSTWAYHSLYHLRAAVDLASLEPPDICTSVEINWLRISSDWLDPTATGMAPTTYYDSNTPGGVPVDGVPDAVPETPLTSWNQTSGALGSTVQVIDVLPGGGSVWNYYKDDQIPDPDDTGEDQQSFGDAGFGVDAPSDQIAFELLTFVLDPAQPNIGATYRSYHTHPLEVTAAAQSYDCSPAGVSFGWPPGTIVGVETTLTASVSEGQAPFTFAWEFGDDGSPASGNPVVHTFILTGTFPVTLTVSNACGTAEPVVNFVTVFAPGEANLAYLPLLLKAHP
jgi:hypothetical protein